MESKRITAATQPLSSLLPQKSRPEPNAPKFMQALAQEIESTTSKTLAAEPATLARQVKPRSHLDLVSLNPLQTYYVPEASRGNASANRECCHSGLIAHADLPFCSCLAYGFEMAPVDALAARVGDSRQPL